MDFSIIENGLPLLLQGMWTTITISFLSVLFGTIVGFLLALMNMSHVRTFKYFAASYIWIIRGIPILIILFILYYAAPFGILLSSYVAGVIGMTINAAAFKAEIIRAGFNAVPKGQIEAAEAIGMTPWKIMFHITLPQAVRIILPPFISNVITVFKSSAQVSVITVPDLMMNAQTLYSSTYKTWETLGVAAVMYFLISSIIMIIQIIVEKKMNVGQRA